MFYVLRGTVKVVSHDNEATYYEIKENNFFGDIGVLYRVPRSMDVLAKNRCTIAILSGEDLVKVMETCPETAKAIGYQSQERYQMYLKRRQSISARRTLDGGTGGPDQGLDDATSDGFAKCDIHSAIRKVRCSGSVPTQVVLFQQDDRTVVTLITRWSIKR
jgi:CRP-like cAMP-binding protein